MKRLKSSVEHNIVSERVANEKSGSEHSIEICEEKRWASHIDRTSKKSNYLGLSQKCKPRPREIVSQIAKLVMVSPRSSGNYNST